MRSFRTPALSVVAAGALVAGVLVGGGSPAVAAPSPDLSVTNVTAHLQQLQSIATATTLRSFSNVGTNATYTQYSHSLTAYKGKTVTIRFTMTEDSSLQTSFVVDDTALNVS